MNQFLGAIFSYSDELIAFCTYNTYATMFHQQIYKVSGTVYMFLMRDEKEGRKKQARSNKQQGKATQHTQGSHFSMYIHYRYSSFPETCCQLSRRCRLWYSVRRRERQCLGWSAWLHRWPSRYVGKYSLSILSKYIHFQSFQRRKLDIVNNVLFKHCVQSLLSFNFSTHELFMRVASGKSLFSLINYS